MPTKPRKSKKRRDYVKFKTCRFCDNPSLIIDYKNVDLLKNFTNKRGKVIARRLSGLCAKHQRKVAAEVKRARFVGLMPFVVYIYR